MTLIKSKLNSFHISKKSVNDLMIKDENIFSVIESLIYITVPFQDLDLRFCIDSVNLYNNICN